MGKNSITREKMRKGLIFPKEIIVGISVVTLILLSLNVVTADVTQTTSNYSEGYPSLIASTPQESIEITSDYNFTDYGFPGIGTAEDPYVIEGYNITTTDENGIYITETTKHFIIRNCYVDAFRMGIFIDDVVESTTAIVNNTCTNNQYGIFVQYSDTSIVFNNTCKENYYHGIMVDTSGSSIIKSNTCTNNDVGICLDDSPSSTISNNNCTNNNFGIWLRFDVSYSSISSNNCTNNNVGIYLCYSNVCVLSYNHLQENSEYGVKLESNGFNVVHNNNFTDNAYEGSSQAYDDGFRNTWYDTENLEGNYWSDYDGTGNYSIDGSAGSADLYPLKEYEESSTSEIQFSFLFALLIFIIFLHLTRIISSKHAKKQ